MEPLTHPGDPERASRADGPSTQVTVIAMGDVTQVAVARRATREVGRRLALDEDCIARAELVVAELANNILQHVRAAAGTPAQPPPTATSRVPRAGELLIGSTICGTAIQIIAADSGVGIRNIGRALEDGFSTAHTPGNGLGAVRRLSRRFDVFSVPAGPGYGAAMLPTYQGTVVSAIVGPALASPSNLTVDDAAVLCAALHGETVSGDSWATIEPPGGDDHLLMVDGLGHGQYAFEAATLAVQSFRRSLRLHPALLHGPLSAILEQMHPLMRATRGAAIALLRIERKVGLVRFCGVGNISSGLIANGETRSMVSHNGTIGHQMPRVQDFTYPYTPGNLLVLHTDGLTNSWKLSNYPGLVRSASATIAGVLYRDAWRGRDDATILVKRLD